MPRRAEAVQEIQTPEPESEKVIKFIRNFCFIPEGSHLGQPAMLLPEQEAQVRRIYDRGKDGTVAGPMAKEDPPLEAVDPWLLRKLSRSC